MKLERRAFQLTECRFEEAADAKSTKMHGYAAKFNSLSENLGGFREKIAPGAFARTLKSADVRFLINHEGLPLARTRSGNLTLREDEVGLYFEAQLDTDDPDVQRIMPKVRRGDLNQMSFAFSLPDRENAKWEKGETPTRTLLDVDLWEISIVTFPAYPATTVGVRNAQEVYDSYLASLQTQDEATKIEQQRALTARQRKLELYKHIL